MRWQLVFLFVAVAAAEAMTLTNVHDPCARVVCRAGRECVVSGGVSQCVCVTRCPDHDKPVCGTDGKSYDNHCLLHQHACLSVSMTYDNHCLLHQHACISVSMTYDNHCLLHQHACISVSMTYDNHCLLHQHACISVSMTYDNHCLLRQHACLSGNHIGVDYTGYCDEDIALAMQEFGMTTKRPTTTTTTPAPSTTTEERLSVCYGPQRDALRDAVISHWQQNVHLQPWHTPNMTYRESLSGHFFSCDKDRNYKLLPAEMLDCFIAVPFQLRPEQDSLITRTLCVDALIELVDSNKDWKLDFQEFTHLLDPQFHPLEKHCSLEGKAYGEGAEVRVECNHCVCATGSWVCATHSCPSDSSAAEAVKTKANDEPFGYMDTKYDLLKNSLDSDEEDYDDDDDYYDDNDDIDNTDSGKSSEEYKNEIAKKEYNLLSATDKKKLDHLESNIRKFYNDLDKWESPKSKNHDVTAASLNSVRDESSDSEESSESEESEETSSEEEEDDLLDQYDDLLDRSQRIRDRLRALRTSISNLEEHRQQHQSESQRFTLTAQPSTTVKPARMDHVALNAIDHSQRVAPSRKHEKYRQYQELLRRKQDRHRLTSQIDNDIWEDQWKAKIKKHHHQTLDNSL
ncbi:Kazal domain [Trinorchestia longiramus]|nr:Kazal domain [Trinorchestia longiramus]